MRTDIGESQRQEIERQADINREWARQKERIAELETVCEEYDKMAVRSNDANSRLLAENKALETDYGLLEISRDHERTLRTSCEQALLERDTKLEKLEAENEGLRGLLRGWLTDMDDVEGAKLEAETL